MATTSNNQEKKHPIIAYRDLIEKKGFIVFDDVNGLPLYDEPYISPFLTIALNLQGSMKADYDMQPIEFGQNEVSVQPPGHSLLAKETSPDYRCVLVAVTTDFFDDMRYLYHSAYLDLRKYNWLPDMRLDDKQFATVLSLFRLMKEIADADTPHRHEVLMSLLNTFTLLMQDFRKAKGIDDRAPSPREELFAKFYQAVSEHYQESREVNFYAELFCLSTKHFAAVIKDHTGRSASEWIRNYVLLKAKSLLLYNHELTIKQVAQQLGFPDQASFSRYFKTYSGVSPSDLRGKN